MSNILIFGTGAVADILVKEYIDLDKNTILGYVNSISKDEKTKNGYPVFGLEQIREHNFDFILLAAGQYDVLYRECIEKGIEEHKIVGIIQEGSEKIKLIENHANEQIRKSFNLNTDNLFIRLLPPFALDTLYVGNNLYLNDSLEIFKKCDSQDNQRVMLLKALAQEMQNNNVQGDVAELGVYKGDFSKILNGLFPDRLLYLFDGFSQADKVFDAKRSLSNVTATTTFKDTSTELVLEKMLHKENCRVVKGIFPESIPSELLGGGQTFAFVSIDADLYLPIYEGLVFFYPRLARNGYILVHDFNNKFYSGAKKAVMEFCANEKIGYVPTTDFNGSIVITK